MSGRPGFALVVSLLFALALSAFGAGIMALGAREAEIATALERRARARAAAETAVRRSVTGWSSRGHAHLQVGESAAWDGRVEDHVDLTVTRLAHTLFIVTATAVHPGAGPPATGRAAALVRTLDPALLALAFPATLVANSEARLETGHVDGLDACGDAPPAPAVLAPVISNQAATLSGPPPATVAPPPLDPAGLFLSPLLDRLATWTHPGGAASPWSAAGGPSLVAVAGSLAVRGGEEHGLLVVDGDLDLVDFRFRGVLLARGHLRVGAGTVVIGAARADVVELQGGEVIRDACAVEEALATGGLDGPFRPTGRWWVPVF